jgi:hypothetical protein
VRDYTFRGKRKDDVVGEEIWAYGYYVAYDEGPNGIKHIIQSPYKHYYYEVDPSTVGQQVPGLTDKKGNPAYEGDRLRYITPWDHCTAYGIIRFGEYRTFNNRYHIGFYVEWEGAWGRDRRNDIGYWLPQTEVCGNEHEEAT